MTSGYTDAASGPHPDHIDELMLFCEYGTTIRFYDEVTQLRQIVYISPVARQVHTLVGGRIGDTIALDGRRPRRRPPAVELLGHHG